MALRSASSRRVNDLPAYQVLAEKLRTRIARDGYDSGSRLPTEIELSRRYRLSRQTVRRAYQELVTEGVVHRTRGRGTFPAPPGHYVRSFGSLDDLLAQSQDTLLEVVRPLHVTARPQPGAREQLQGGEIMEVALRRIHRGLPFSYTAVSLPAYVGRKLRRFPALLRAGSRRPVTILGLVDRALDRPVAMAKQVIDVAIVPAGVARLIGCKRGQAVLRVERLFLSQDGKPVELAVNYFNPERYSYRQELTRMRT